MTTIVTGVDPTTATPSGPSVDDGGAAPINSDDITGTVVVGAHPGVLDGGVDLVQTGGGPAIQAGTLLAWGRRSSVPTTRSWVEPCR